MACVELQKLIRAIKTANLEAIESLCRSGVDVNQSTPNGLTPLSIAAINGNTRVIQALLDAGADVNLQTELIGHTPLSWAVWAKKKRAAELLRSAGGEHEKSNLLTEYDEHFAREHGLI